jgi:hypothetical protein
MYAISEYFIYVIYAISEYLVYVIYAISEYFILKDFYFYRNATVDLTHIDTPPNMSAWPQFHNGVSAGLRMANSSQVCKILGILIHTCTKFSETVNLNCF